MMLADIWLFESSQALKHLEGHMWGQYKLKVIWAKPSSKQRARTYQGMGSHSYGSPYGGDSFGGGLSSNSYVSGYGQALAQDTTDKVHVTH